MTTGIVQILSHPLYTIPFTVDSTIPTAGPTLNLLTAGPGVFLLCRSDLPLYTVREEVFFSYKSIKWDNSIVSDSANYMRVNEHMCVYEVL